MSWWTLLLYWWHPTPRRASDVALDAATRMDSQGLSQLEECVASLQQYATMTMEIKATILPTSK